MGTSMNMSPGMDIMMTVATVIFLVLAVAVPFINFRQYFQRRFLPGVIWMMMLALLALDAGIPTVVNFHTFKSIGLMITFIAIAAEYLVHSFVAPSQQAHNRGDEYRAMVFRFLLTCGLLVCVVFVFIP